MSFLPTAGPEESSRESMAQQYPYYENPATPASPTSAQHLYHGDGQQSPYKDWSVLSSSAPDPQSIAQPMAWPSHNPHGLSLDLMATATHGMFDSQYPTPISSHLPTTWGAPNGLPLAAALFPEYSTQQMGMGDCYAPDQALQSTSSWTTNMQEPPRFNPVYSSPGHSEYSASSCHSFVGSEPYALTERNHQLPSPAFIKVEDIADSYRSLPNTPSLNQAAHVKPGDVYTNPSSSTGNEASNTPTSLSTKQEEDEDDEDDEDDEEDAKPLALRQRTRTRRSTSEHESASGGDHRPKRSFTTHANSTCHCEKCGKPFRRSYNLKAHMATHNPNRDQPHACRHHGCRRKFVRKTDLVRHQRSVHLKERLFRCSLCHSAFARKDTLRRHIDDGCPRRNRFRKRAEEAQEDAESVEEEDDGSPSVPERDS